MLRFITFKTVPARDLKNIGDMLREKPGQRSKAILTFSRLRRASTLTRNCALGIMDYVREPLKLLSQRGLRFQCA